MTRKTIQNIQDKKDHNQKITMLTAYDYPLATLIDDAGIDIILVGDSLANVVLGLDSTKEVDIEGMLHHAKAVNRAVKNALVVGDMPFDAYQADPQDAVPNAARLMQEGGCDAVKVEWFDGCLGVVAQLVKEGIPVMGHVGLTPQTVEALGGYKVQGRDMETAQKIIEQAKSLQCNGCFSVVLECVPEEVAQIITRTLHIPTISCGAGVYCDGQVLVINDLLGLTLQHTPKFVKPYLQLKDSILEGLVAYRREVESKTFPDEAHSYHMEKEERKKLLTRYPGDAATAEEG
jgi:3-methyl-2-oxobutanoate hydroxymethyltransferase